MKTLFLCGLVLLFVLFGCEKQPTDIGNVPDEIVFVTDKLFYTSADTLQLRLINNSESGIIIGLRCGGYLEMFYQKKEDDHWSENLWFSYMSLRCVTVVDTVPRNETFFYPLPADMFDSTGIFRLLVGVYDQETDSSMTIFSNPFKIVE
ncbi:MAG: hypothetical protein D6681_07850 [Calditrichaeota bacterium]|nr:MAG: hypothetical protein D6681_07850 [Calditrichota bacterium]